MDLNALVELLFGLMGGLGIFLLGMKNMSDGMQAVAGASLRRLIGFVTNNRFLATIVGVVVTCVVQSSSVTTVMVVGFVNSSVMELSQAIGVIDLTGKAPMAVIDDAGAPDPADTLLSMHWDAKTARLLGVVISADQQAY